MGINASKTPLDVAKTMYQSRLIGVEPVYEYDKVNNRKTDKLLGFHYINILKSLEYEKLKIFIESTEPLIKLDKNKLNHELEVSYTDLELSCYIMNNMIHLKGTATSVSIVKGEK
ncbi:hypothetical protein OKW23_000712 [Bacilli bacterium PM5-9]|nr:hypothetical protein [Bacilli bacterium PM5-9]